MPTIFELRQTGELVVGNFTFRGVPTQVNHHGPFRSHYPGAATLGYELLSLHVVRIDYPRRRMWLKRIPGAPKTFYGRPYQRFEDLTEPSP